MEIIRAGASGGACSLSLCVGHTSCHFLLPSTAVAYMAVTQIGQACLAFRLIFCHFSGWRRKSDKQTFPFGIRMDLRGGVAAKISFMRMSSHKEALFSDKSSVASSASSQWLSLRLNMWTTRLSIEFIWMNEKPCRHQASCCVFLYIKAPRER